jgi:uncharacterized membrane protein YeaQ/YmgE (transglycosylase-associated protein family)
MSFLSFLLLTVIGGIVAGIYYFGLRYRGLEGPAALFGKLMVGWMGAWLGSPVFGHWLWKFENVYIVPAILGAVAGIHMSYLTWMFFSMLLTNRRQGEQVRPMKAAA